MPVRVDYIMASDRRGSAGRVLPPTGSMLERHLRLLAMAVQRRENLSLLGRVPVHQLHRNGEDHLPLIRVNASPSTRAATRLEAPADVPAPGHTAVGWVNAGVAHRNAHPLGTGDGGRRFRCFIVWVHLRLEQR